MSRTRWVTVSFAPIFIEFITPVNHEIVSTPQPQLAGAPGLPLAHAESCVGQHVRDELPNGSGRRLSGGGQTEEHVSYV